LPKAIVVGDDVYEILRRMCTSGQSISEVVRRRVRDYARIQQFYDVRSISGREIDEAVAEESGLLYRVKL
jgi:predicted CopG family antitoxin